MSRILRFLKWATRSERRAGKRRQHVAGNFRRDRRLVCETLEPRALLSGLPQLPRGNLFIADTYNAHIRKVAIATSVTIGRATPSVTLASASSAIAYDGMADVTCWAMPQLTGVSGASTPGGSASLIFYAGPSAAGTPLSSPPVNAGTYTVVAAYAGDTNYTAAQARLSRSPSTARQRAWRSLRRQPVSSLMELTA